MYFIRFSIYIIVFTIINISNLAFASEKYMLLQTTTSLRDSGFLEYIIPEFNKYNDAQIRYVASGTGKALTNASVCNADLLIVHSEKDEREFIKNGYGSMRNALMYNQFVLISPANNPANISENDNISESFSKIADSKSVFLSRGDDSGTHKAETKFWNIAQIDPTLNSGGWYLETGLGMGSTLNIAVNLDAYVLSDIATWLKYKNKSNHRLIAIKDDQLLNIYSIISINEKRCPEINYNLAALFKGWLLSSDGQAAIQSYTVDKKQLFHIYP